MIYYTKSEGRIRKSQMKKTMMKTIGSLSAKFVAMSLAFMCLGSAWGESPVAQVITDGGATTNKYESLAEAFTAANEAGTATIQMLEDVDVTNVAYVVSLGSTVTLDLNGKIVKGTDNTNGGFAFITNNGTFTIDDTSANHDGELVYGTLTPNMNQTPGYGNYTIENEGTLNIVAGTVRQTTRGPACYAVNNSSRYSNAVFNMQGGLMTSPGNAVRAYGLSDTYENEVNISGGSIAATGAGALWVQLGSPAPKVTLNVTGGSMSGSSYAFFDVDYGNSLENVTYNIQDGTFTGEIFTYGATTEISGGTFNGPVTEKAGSLTISDGTFNDTVEAYGGGTVRITDGTFNGTVVADDDGTALISGGLFASQVRDDYCAEGYIPTDEDPLTGMYTVMAGTYVAQIVTDGGATTNKYESLAEAIAAVPADGTETTITMIADETINANAGVTIPANKNVVLDLNGKTITGVVQSPTTAQTILNRGALVITDSSDGKNGKITNVVSDENAGSPGVGKNWASNAIRNEGDLTVNAGNIINTGMGGACYAIDNYYAGQVTINGGVVDAAKASAIRMFDNNGGKVTVTDGTIGHYTSDSDCSYMGVQVQNGSNADVEITGGNFAATYAVYSKGTGDSSVSISNGTFDGYVAFGSAGPDDIAISGGTFLLPVGTAGNQTGFISGGIFANDVDEAYCAQGYISAVYDAQNGLYIVRQGHYVAQIVTDGGATTNKYESLAEAVAAVPTDGTETTIEMIADYSFSGNEGVIIAKTQNVVLDLNGHVVSHTAPGADDSYCIYNDGKLTIKDSSDTNADGTGTGKLTTFAETVDTGVKPGYANDLILNDGEVTVMSGLLENTSAAGATYVIDLNWPESDSHVKINIDGGCISAPHSTGVRMYAFVVGDNDYAFNMTGGKIDAYGYGIHTYSPDSGVKVEINISGGTVSSSSYMAIYDEHEKYQEPTACDNMTYNITGGTFSSASDNYDYKCSLWTYGAALNISGGVFENDVCAYTKKVNITDGEFNSLLDFYCYVSGATLDWSVSGGRFADELWDYGQHPTGFITGGVFTWPPYDDITVDPYVDLIPEGYITVANTDAETKVAYPYTVVAAILHFVYPIEGTAGVPVANEWLAAQFPSIYPDATKPILASITNDLVQALSANGANDMPKWESYVLGLDPADPTAKLRLTAAAKDATTVTITGIIDTTKFPEPTGTTVKFRLAKRNGDEWTNLATGSETPSFDCLLEDVAGEELAIFADIVTE